MPPKSAKLSREDAQLSHLMLPESVTVNVDSGEPIKIKPIPCCNEFVAVLRSSVTGNVIVSNAYKNEGVVVGIGPGLPDNNGARIKTQLKLGDVVMFIERNIVSSIEPKDGLYAGKSLVIIQERNLICKLPPTKFILVDENGNPSQTTTEHVDS